jgi:hypothetical protein
MNAYELADQVEMWGEDLLALNMKGGIPVVQGAKMLRHQADYIAQLEKGLESSIAMNKAQAERQVKELTDEDRSMLIRTLKWAEDLLREAGHDEAVNDVQDCLMILRKAQEK